MRDIYVGNTQDSERRGWIAGHFYPITDIRYAANVEVRHSCLLKGMGKKEWSEPVYATTFWLVLSGRLRNEYQFSDGVQTAVACNEGEYAIVLPGACHRWEVEENCQVFAVRWPSFTPSEAMPYIFPQLKSGIGQSYAIYDLSRTTLPFLVSESIQPPDLRCVSGITVRYEEYISGQIRTRYSEGGIVILALLVHGRIDMNFPKSNHRRVALGQNGDYVITDTSSSHYLEAIRKATTVTVSWPLVTT